MGKIEDLPERPQANSGDRVLVLKPLYHIRSPRRGDVVVFKFPDAPQENHVAANYIKRAMGFGGETVAIHRGKLYVTRALVYPENDPNYPRPEDPLDLWRKPYMYENSAQALELFELSRQAGFTDRVPGGFQIVRKEEDQLLADLRLVWDNDRQPRDLAGVVLPRWAPAGTAGRWNQDNPLEPRAFTHGGDQPDWIRYQHRTWKKVNSTLRFKLTDQILADLRQVRVPEPVLAKLAPLKERVLTRDPLSNDPKFDDRIAEVLTAEELKQYQELVWNFGGTRYPWRWPDPDYPLPIIAPIDNMLGYNAGIDYNPDRREVVHRDHEQVREASMWVGDLCLECEVDLGAGAEVALDLSRGANRFRATFANGQVALSRSGPKGPEFGTPTRPYKVTGAVQKFRFANIDSRLWVWVDGKRIDFGTEGDYTPVETNEFDPEDTSREGWVRANDIEEPAKIGARGPVSVRAIKLYRDIYYTRSGGDHTGADTFYVQPGHYLCLGDNSAQSSDSRRWGAVPERLLLGKAVFVFFPVSFNKSTNRVGFIK
jgi:signal peptidase I